MFLPLFAQKSYYVVVGAFSTDGNADELIARLPNSATDTAYAVNDDNLVHLYVLRTGDRQTAAEKSMLLQKSIEELRQANDSYESVTISKADEEIGISVKSEIASYNPNVTMTEASGARGSESESAVGNVPAGVKSNMYKFTISNSKGKELPGKVHFIDFQKQKELASYDAFTYNDIMHVAKSSDVAVVCGIFGYKEIETFLDASNPSLLEGAYRDGSGAWVVPYELKRLEKGDVSVMYNVAFHKDAVPMLPQSKSDLDELVTMMYENPGYEITIHGHCNGKQNRKIIAMGPATNYFELAGTKKFHGTAKELTELRAAAIEQYLLDHGVNPKRIRTFAWGGRYKLVDEESTHASLNDRIEIEIRKD
ncbi:MAG TPA: OmpA family protein [Chryseosolibacter sp.]|nr:OmpA family protein [Chryseosolibacter sp.]